MFREERKVLDEIEEEIKIGKDDLRDWFEDNPISTIIDADQERQVWDTVETTIPVESNKVIKWAGAILMYDPWIASVVENVRVDGVGYQDVMHAIVSQFLLEEFTSFVQTEKARRENA